MKQFSFDNKGSFQNQFSVWYEIPFSSEFIYTLSDGIEIQDLLFINFILITRRYIFEKIDLSVGSTETKYIKLKTKPQNIIVIFGIFHIEWYYYFGFFWNNLTKIPVVTKRSAVLVFGLLVF